MGMGNDIYCWWNQILYFLLNSFSKEPKVVIKQYLHVLSFTGHGWISLNWSGNLFVIIKRRSGLYSNAAKTINLHNILDLQVKNVDETTDLINLVVVRKMNGLIQTIAIKGSHKIREYTGCLLIAETCFSVHKMIFCWALRPETLDLENSLIYILTSTFRFSYFSIENSL